MTYPNQEPTQRYSARQRQYLKPPSMNLSVNGLRRAKNGKYYTKLPNGMIIKVNPKDIPPNLLASL